MWIRIFISAGIGGMSPDLVAMARNMMGILPVVPGELYFIGLLIFFGLEGAVASIFGETDVKKAFLSG